MLVVGWKEAEEEVLARSERSVSGEGAMLVLKKR